MDKVEHPCGTSRLWCCWKDMKKRCYQKGDKDYKSYGGKGIGVCPEWVHSYVEFRKWALANGYTDDLTIDRIDPTKDYSPDNCRWIPWFQNVTRNAKPITAWDETKFIWEWTEDERCKVSKNHIQSRLHQDWKPEDALSLPAGQRRTKSLDTPSNEP